MVRHTSLILSEILAGLLAGLVALGGLAAWRLHAGPVPLDFLTPHLETALNEESGGYVVDIDQTVAVWAGWRNAIDIRATNVSVTAPDGAPLAWVPELSLGLSLRALVRGRLAPTGLDALRPSIRVVRLVNGEFSMGFSGLGGDAQPRPGNPKGARAGEAIQEAGRGEEIIRFVIGELLSDPDPDRTLGYLRRLSVIDARVVFEDRVARKFFRSPAATVSLFKTDDGIVGDAYLPLEYEGRLADLRGQLDVGREGERYSARFDFRNLELAEFAPSFPQIAELVAFKMPLRGEIALSGAVHGGVERIEFDLVGSAGTLDLRELYREPIDLHGLLVSGSASPNLQQIVIDEAILDLGGPLIHASAAFAIDARESTMRLSGQLKDMPMASLERYWPPSLGPVQRKWVTEHMTNGVAREATIEIAGRRSNDGTGAIVMETIAGTLVYDDLSVDYLNPMPIVTGIDGRGTYDHDGLYLGVESGRVGEGVTITGGQVDITGMSKMGNGNPAQIVIVAKTEGDARSAVEILDHEPLSLGRKLGFDPANLSGTMAADIRFEFPLTRTLTTDMLAITTAARLENTSLLPGPFGLRVTGGNLDLDLTEHGMRISGDILLNDVNARLDWDEHFRGSGDFKRRFVVAGELDRGGRMALGLPDLSYWIEGPANTELTHTIRDDQPDQLTLRADLRRSLVKVPVIGWRKERGLPGTLAVEGTLSEEAGLVFDRFDLVTDDMDGRLVMEFQRDLSDIRKVTVKRALYRGNDVTGTITVDKDGSYQLDLKGDRIDVRHFLDADANGMASSDRTAATRPFFVKAQFKEAQTSEDRRVYGAQFIGKYDGRHWRLATLDAQLDQGANLALRYEPDESEGYNLSIESHDAGQALRTLDWFNQIQGGSLVIKGRRAATDAPLKGTFTVKDYRLVEAPAGLQFLQLLTVVGLPAAVSSRGVSFVSMDGSYSYADGVLTLGNVDSFGATTGLHIDKGAVLDFNKNTINMTGVAIPAYAAQGAIGKIPLIGDILTGGEGLIATNFQIVGKFESPEVRVSPLSALPLPGFIRKMFRVPGGEGEPKDGDRPGAESPRMVD